MGASGKLVSRTGTKNLPFFHLTPQVLTLIYPSYLTHTHMLTFDTYLGLSDMMKHLIGHASSVHFLRHEEILVIPSKKHSSFTLTQETEVTSNKLLLIFFLGERDILFYFILFIYLFILFIFLTSLLEYNCFTMVCQFLLYNKVNQLYIYIYRHIFSLLHLPPTLPIPPLQVVTKH